MIMTKAIDSAVEMTYIATNLYGDHIAVRVSNEGVVTWLYLRDPTSSTPVYQESFDHVPRRIR